MSLVPGKLSTSIEFTQSLVNLSIFHSILEILNNLSHHEKVLCGCSTTRINKKSKESHLGVKVKCVKQKWGILWHLKSSRYFETDESLRYVMVWSWQKQVKKKILALSLPSYFLYFFALLYWSNWAEVCIGSSSASLLKKGGKLTRRGHQQIEAMTMMRMSWTIISTSWSLRRCFPSCPQHTLINVTTLTVFSRNDTAMAMSPTMEKSIEK